MKNKQLGQEGEVLAADFLNAKGYQVLEKNYKNRLGEIDLICKEGDSVVFVEVKTRLSLSCGSPKESVHYYKQRKMLKLAQSYLLYKYRTCDILSRFDVVSIYRDPAGQNHVEHLINAFE